MARFKLRNLFNRNDPLPLAANDANWELTGANAAAEHSASKNRILQIADFELHQRDLGADTAAELQRLIYDRLKPELSSNESLALKPNGTFELVVHDTQSVDADKLTNHLINRVFAETFSVDRCLIECELNTAS